MANCVLNFWALRHTDPRAILFTFLEGDQGVNESSNPADHKEQYHNSFAQKSTNFGWKVVNNAMKMQKKCPIYPQSTKPTSTLSNKKK